MQESEIVLYSIAALLFIAIYLRIVFSVGRVLDHQKMIIRLLQGIAIKSNVDEKYLYTPSEITIKYPKKKED